MAQLSVAPVYGTAGVAASAETMTVVAAMPAPGVGGSGAATAKAGVVAGGLASLAICIKQSCCSLLCRVGRQTRWTRHFPFLGAGCPTAIGILYGLPARGGERRGRRKVVGRRHWWWHGTQAAAAAAAETKATALSGAVKARWWQVACRVAHATAVALTALDNGGSTLPPSAARGAPCGGRQPRLFSTPFP